MCSAKLKTFGDGSYKEVREREVLLLSGTNVNVWWAWSEDLNRYIRRGMRGEKWKSINSVSTRILNGPVLSMGKNPLHKQPQQTPGAYKHSRTE